MLSKCVLETLSTTATTVIKLGEVKIILHLELATLLTTYFHVGIREILTGHATTSCGHRT